ncbi:MAG: L-2-hydroxyglutarate oxidase [Kouleothrix sp.]
MSYTGNESDHCVDLTIVGAGIVGLATARALLMRYPALRLVVLDKEPAIAQHQTGRNSGVIHSGLYYKPGSLKARLCVQGAAAMLRYCDEHGIAYNLCGKVVVATTPAELPRLRELYQRGIANGITQLELIGPERLREIEPHAVGIEAIYSPNTAIVDYRCVAEAYAADIQSMGGEVRTGYEVRQIARTGRRVWLDCPAGMIETRYLITCAGVYSDRMAALSGAPSEPRIVPFRGDYYILAPAQRHLINALIYPVPDPAFPFLGVHSTLKVDGSIWLGPNAVLAFGREGYRRYDVNLPDLVDALGYRGFQRLARSYWRVGMDEMVRDWSKRLFVAAVQRFVPAITADGVVAGPAGIRAQALAPDGSMVDDFVFHQEGPVIHVRNAPSPGATSSLMIAEMISDMAAKAFDL